MDSSEPRNFLQAPEDAICVAVFVGRNGDYGSGDRICFDPHRRYEEPYDLFTKRQDEIKNAKETVL